MGWVPDFYLNSDFSVDTGWTKGTGFAITGGRLAVTLNVANNYCYPITMTDKVRRRYTFKMTTPNTTARRALHTYFGNATSVDSTTCTNRLLWYTDGNIYLLHGAGPTSSLLQSYSASTAYTVVAVLNADTDKLESVTINGTTYDNGGAGYDFQVAQTGVSRILFNNYSESQGFSTDVDDVVIEYWDAAYGGETPTPDGAYTVVKFLHSGEFVTPSNVSTAEVLVIAGGGGGVFGAGGAGGYLSGTENLSGTMSVQVGPGGEGRFSGGAFRGGKGLPSSFGTLSATGGGGGGAQSSEVTGGAGGSGGGGTYNNNAGGSASPAGQGNAGAAGNTGSPYKGGGGGGAGASPSANSPNGGAGLNSDIVQRGVNVGYAGGGGGGAYTTGPGTASFGGGAGGAGSAAGTAGTDYTGAGGGGSGNGGTGGTGGYGVVIIRYLTPASGQLTFYTASDNYLQFYTNASYANMRSLTGVSCYQDPAGGGDMFIGQKLETGYYSCFESFLAFDTSALPDDCTITAATLSLWGLNDSSVTDFVLEARAYDFGTSVTTGDMVSGDTYAALPLLSTYATSGGWTTGSYYSLTSQAAFLSAINKTGQTRIILCSDRFANANAPSGTEFVTADTADSGGNGARLVVTYTAASSSYLPAVGRHHIIGKGVRVHG